MQNLYPISRGYTFVRFALFAIVALLVLWRPVQLQPDSIGYLESWFNRPPVYPLLIAFFESLFGSYYLTALKVFQLGLGLFSIHFFTSEIRKLTSLNALFSLVLTAILLIPYVYNQLVANYVLTEALAYPLYLVISVKALVFLQHRNFKQLGPILVLMLLLLLIRKQFLFVLPFLILILLWTGYQTKNFRKSAIGIIAVLAVPFLATQIDCTYHKIVHGHYVATPWNGIHLLAPAMYVADAEDVRLYDDEVEKQFFLDMHASIEKKEVTSSSQPAYFKDRGVEHYLNSFPAIANATLYTEGIVRFENKLPSNEALIELNKVTTAMTPALIMDNFKKWITVYIKNMMHGFGSAKHFLFYALLACIGFYFFKKKDVVFNTMLLFSLFLISNVAIIATGMHALKRFTFYNDWVLFLVVFLLIQRYFTQVKKVG